MPRGRSTTRMVMDGVFSRYALWSGVRASVIWADQCLGVGRGWLGYGWMVG